MAEPSVDIPEAVTEKQCVYCGNRFDSDILAQHQLLMHKGDMPTEEVQLPKGAEKLGAGSTIRAGQSSTTAGVPIKVGWSKRLLEEGVECNDSGCKVTDEGGWRFIPEEGMPVPALCFRCGGPTHQISEMVEWDAPENSPHTASFQNLFYTIAAGETNRLPAVIRDIARESIASTRAAVIPPISQVAQGQTGRLSRVGWIDDSDEGTN